MRKFILAFSLLLPSFAYANYISIECSLKFSGIPEKVIQQVNEAKPTNNIVADIHTSALKSVINSSKWWKREYWQKVTITFLIDETTSQSIPVAGDGSYITKVKLYPETIYIDQYKQLEDKKTLEIVSRFIIDRITGELFGKRIAPDNSWEPYYKKSEKIYTMRGMCKPWARKF